MKKYFKTLKEAKTENKKNNRLYHRIYDLGKHRKVKRFFLGTYIEWLNL